MSKPNGLNQKEIETFVDDVCNEAREIAMSRFGNAFRAIKEDGTDVTEADLAIQEMMISRIHKAYPDHMIIGEEGQPGIDGAEEGKFCWILDPLDGTRNYVRGIPVFATAIAILRYGMPVFAWIEVLPWKDVFMAHKGSGAFRNGEPIQAYQKGLSQRTLIGMQSTRGALEKPVIDDLAGLVVMRNLGSIALHLSLVACGGMGGAVASEARLWDMAGGVLLIEEAGGVCTNWHGRPLFPMDPLEYENDNMPFLAGGPRVHADLVEHVRTFGRGPRDCDD